MRFRPRLVRALLLGGFRHVSTVRNGSGKNGQGLTFRAGVNAVLVDVGDDGDGQPVSARAG
jgi:hypothetical protein